MTTKADIKKNFAVLIGDDTDAQLEEFYKSYKDGVGDALRDLNKGIAAADFQAIRAAAHSLKGISLTAGHPEATELSLSISASAKAFQLEPIKALQTRLAELYAQM